MGFQALAQVQLLVLELQVLVVAGNGEPVGVRPNDGGSSGCSMVFDTWLGMIPSLPVYLATGIVDTPYGHISTRQPAVSCGKYHTRPVVGAGLGQVDL